MGFERALTMTRFERSIAGKHPRFALFVAGGLLAFAAFMLLVRDPGPASAAVASAGLLLAGGRLTMRSADSSVRERVGTMLLVVDVGGFASVFVINLVRLAQE